MTRPSPGRLHRDPIGPKTPPSQAPREALEDRYPRSVAAPPPAIGMVTITIWLLNIAMERSTIFKNGKPSISMGHFPHQTAKNLGSI